MRNLLCSAFALCFLASLGVDVPAMAAAAGSGSTEATATTTTTTAQPAKRTRAKRRARARRASKATPVSAEQNKTEELNRQSLQKSTTH